jgi:hypothetical protein
MQELIILSGALDPPRTPASVLGVLCRKYFPSLVDLGDDKWEPAYLWDRYQLAPDDQNCNKQEQILAEFWVSLSQHSSIHRLHWVSLFLK